MASATHIENNGEFELWQKNIPYKRYVCSPDKHIVNIKTGENCGTCMILYINADGTKDEDCYKFVKNEE